MAVPSMSKTNIFIALGALILIGAGITVGAQKRPFGSFMSQEIVLEDISFSLGGEQRLIAPKIIITGSNQSKESVEALFQEKNLLKLRERLTTYSADKIIIPELLAKGGIFESKTEHATLFLQNTVFLNINKGKVARIDLGEMKAEAISEPSLVLTGSMKSSSIVDLDLLLGFDILTTNAESVDVPLKMLAKAIVFNDIAFEHQGDANARSTGEISIKSLEVKDFKGRPYAYYDFGKNDSESDLERLTNQESDVFENARDILDGLTAFEMVLDIKGFHISLTFASQSQPNTITFGQLNFDKNLFEIQNLVFEGSENNETVQSSYKTVRYSDFSFQPVIDGLKYVVAQMDQGVKFDYDNSLELLKYMPKFGTFLMEDGTIRITKPEASEPEEFFFKKILISVREQLNGLPISGLIEYDQFKLPLAVITSNVNDDGARLFFKLYSDAGIKDFIISNSLDYAWDEEKEEFIINKLSFDIEHFFSVQFSARFTNFSKALFSLKPNSYFALMGIRWNEAKLHYSEAIGFKKRIIETIETKFSGEEKPSEEKMEETLNESLDGMVENSLKSQIIHAGKLFLTESVEIEMTAKVKEDRGLGFEAYGMIDDAKSLLDLIDIKITAKKK